MVVDLMTEAEAEAQREAMAATSVANPNLPSPNPPPSHDGHPITHAARHVKGRTPPVR